MGCDRIRHLQRDERGIAVVYVGLGFMAFMAATMLAVDVGMSMTARAQAQNSADAGALAGAIALAFNDFNDRSATGPAVTSAISAATSNSVIGGTPSVTVPDVTFSQDPAGNNDRVTVQVFRTAARSNAIPTSIAAIFGTSSVDIGATATAEASPADAETCVKPFMIPDRWIDNTGQPDNFDYVDNKGNLIPNHDVYNGDKTSPDYTGYKPDRDKGTMLVLRAGTGNNISPTMYFSWKMPSQIGGDYYRDNISGCNTTVIPLAGDYYMTQEPGDMSGPTNQGIDDLIAKDPNAVWNDTCKCVKNSAFGGVSPRVTPIPLYDPVYYAVGKANGRNADFKLANVLGFFIDHRDGNQVYGYITPISGLSTGAGAGPAGAFPVAIKLVQ